MNSARETLRRDFGGDIIEPGAAEYESASRSLFASGSPGLRASARQRRRRASSRPIRRPRRACAVRARRRPRFPGLRHQRRRRRHRPRQPRDCRGRRRRHSTWCGSAAEPPGDRSPPALAPHGLAISAGDTKSVGVGGLTLTGGIGWKVRKYGLALDQRRRRRGGPRRRNRGAGKRAREPGAVLGDPRWRRQLRDRDRVRVRGPPDDRRLLRQDHVPGVGGGPRAAGLGGLPALRTRRAHLRRDPGEPGGWRPRGADRGPRGRSTATTPSSPPTHSSRSAGSAR